MNLTLVNIFLLLSVSLGTLNSCISSKNIVYFNNLPDSQRVVLETLIPPDPKIQINDKIRIKIGGENVKTVEYITQQFLIDNKGSFEAMVDINGNIALPHIGNIKVGGLSKEQATITITNAYKEYLINPIIFIDFNDFNYTVLGEVRSPGTNAVAANKVSLLEAIANAGDLTEYAERKKVKIIRDENNQRVVLSVDLTDKSILNSSDYYLHPNDIVYVAPKDVKQTTSNFQRSLLLFSGVASLITIIIVLFKR